MEERLVAYVFMLLGILIIAVIALEAIKANKSELWSVTQGRILYQGTDIKNLKTDLDAPNNKNSVWKNLYLDFEYEYQVNGQTFKSKRVTYSQLGNKVFFTTLDAMLKSYIKGEPVNIYYNPNNPKQSVILPGTKIWNFLPMLTGFLFIAVSLYLPYTSFL